MNNPILNYPNLSEQFRKLNLLLDPAEMQGLCAGLLCAGIEAQSSILSLPEELEPIRQQIQNRLYTELNRRSFPIHLILPEEENDKIQAIRAWSEGFLHGLAWGGQTLIEKLSPESQEALQDMIEITRIQEQMIEPDDQEDLAHLEDYLWVALLTIWQDLHD